MAFSCAAMGAAPSDARIAGDPGRSNSSAEVNSACGKAAERRLNGGVRRREEAPWTKIRGPECPVPGLGKAYSSARAFASAMAFSCAAMGASS